MPHNGIRRCQWCADRYRPKRRDQRTCSAVCRRRHNRDEQNAKRYIRHSPKLCANCPTVFTPTRADSNCCSVKCRERTRRVTKSYWKSCGQCADMFIAHRSDRVFCSSRCSIAAWKKANPGVHRLRVGRYAQRRQQWVKGHSITERDWMALQKRCAGRCYYCGTLSERLEMDHILPLSRGGQHRIGNVVPACPSCNNRKGSRLLSEWRYKHRAPVRWATR